SPGTHSETAYDQAFVASALGFPLVQGSDLVVRDGWVWMKQPGVMSTERLERVDVILRRVDAAWTDPLELRGDSQLGVAGLTEAVRRGRVRIVNGLGAGVVENPALLPFMPAMCEALLGEQLRLDSVPTLWCGDQASREQVLDRIDELSIRSIDGPSAGLAGLTARELTARILAAPHRYVGQELLPLSQAPTWGAGGRLTGTAQPRPVTLRTFTLRYGSAYRPLIGGLANVFESATRGATALASKDVWVLKDSAADPDQGLSDVLPMTSARSVSVLVPRIVEDMFWMGRYAERGEDLIRLLLAAQPYAEDYKARPRTSGFTTLDVLMSAIHSAAGPSPADAEDPYDLDFRSILLDTSRVGSVAHSFSCLRDAMQGVRDQLSNDGWRGFGVIDRATYALVNQPHSHQVAESAGRMLTGVLALHGVTASMMRDPGWHMIGAGRYLERALGVCHLLAATTTVRRGIDVDREVLSAVLEAAESSITHRRRYRGYVRPAGVLELLLLDMDNPRSLAFCLSAIREHLEAQPASTGSTRPERLLSDLDSALAETEIAALVAIGGVGRPNLEAFLAATTNTLLLLGEAIEELHFAAGPAPRALGPMDMTDIGSGAAS
ncbi:circularly permuted type 2 ATP-grasp protein, partial [Nocardioides sp.]|uniref:circularly permuted type 2 ATP-grasp protein n=1 Tax=Nocardioides sp. TaxID=35761 RepID=UPI003569E9C3